LSLQIVDVKKSPLDEREARMLAEIETYPRVREWDVDIHTEDLDKMYLQFKEFLGSLPDDKDQIFLVAELNRKVVGFLGIHRKGKRMKHVGVVGVTARSDYWRKGFGTRLPKAGIECARREGFIRLEADTLAKNKAMRRIAEKLGFKLEGIRRMRVKMNKEYEDEALLALVLM